MFLCFPLFTLFAGTSIFDPEVCLVGASGGVYALLAAHLANVMLNFHQMRYGILRLIVILMFGEYETHITAIICTYKWLPTTLNFKYLLYKYCLISLQHPVTLVLQFMNDMPKTIRIVLQCRMSRI